MPPCRPCPRPPPLTSRFDSIAATANKNEVKSKKKTIAKTTPQKKDTDTESGPGKERACRPRIGEGAWKRADKLQGISLLEPRLLPTPHRTVRHPAGA